MSEIKFKGESAEFPFDRKPEVLIVGGPSPDVMKMLERDKIRGIIQGALVLSCSRRETEHGDSITAIDIDDFWREINRALSNSDESVNGGKS